MMALMTVIMIFSQYAHYNDCNDDNGKKRRCYVLYILTLESGRHVIRVRVTFGRQMFEACDMKNAQLHSVSCSIKQTLTGRNAYRSAVQCRLPDNIAYDRPHRAKQYGSLGGPVINEYV